MSAFEQLQTIRRNIAKVQCPQILFMMNKKARELEEEIERLNQIPVHYELLYD
jgi:hypothetical protein